MPLESQGPSTRDAEPYALRRLEAQALADALPLKGVEGRSRRVFNIWGEKSVGKSTFLSAFREGEFMLRAKALWIQPTREGKLDTVQEFIRACSQHLRYPSAPDKEKKISDNLESVQRGKVNPIVSDDSILITRSSIAANKKPYINQAAAASVGRTETQRDDVEINVGLGESKASNQAEGFLDALPLQALGTDLTIIHVDRLELLSLTIRDWLRDYVIPAATRGPYRRSVVLLVESLDPLPLAHSNEKWGEWDHLRHSLRIRPLCDDDAYELCLGAGLPAPVARFIQRQTCGYPEAINAAIEDAKRGAFDGPERADAGRLINGLSSADQAKLAALCLPDLLYPDEVDALLGPQEGAKALSWLARLPEAPTQRVGDGKAYALSKPFRVGALEGVEGKPVLDDLMLRWRPLRSVLHNAPERTDRAKLLVLSGLLWVDESFCRSLFAAHADNALAFPQQNPDCFNRHQDRFRVTDRILPELRKVAENMGHPGADTIVKKAETLWAKRRQEIESDIAKKESALNQAHDKLNGLTRRQSEAVAQLRIQERKSSGQVYSEAMQAAAAQPSKGSLIIVLAVLALVAFGIGFVIPFPYSLAALVAGLACTSVALAYVPGWMARRKAISISQAAQNQDSPEFIRKRSLDLTHEVQILEHHVDTLKLELAAAKALLRYPLIPEATADTSEAETTEPGDTSESAAVPPQ